MSCRSTLTNLFEQIIDNTFPWTPFTNLDDAFPQLKANYRIHFTFFKHLYLGFLKTFHLYNFDEDCCRII